MNVKGSYMFLSGTVTISLGIGAIAGYFFAKKQLETEYVGIAQQEIAEAKMFYSALHKTGKYATPESTIKNRVNDKTVREAGETVEAVRAVRALRNYQGVSKTDSSESKEKTNYNKPNEDRNLIISEDGFDYAEEEKLRSPHAPYVISKEEFGENEDSYEQVTITYFVGDDVVMDEKEEVIENQDEVVGEDNLLRFGDGSGNPHIVYIRNEKLTLDFEVIKDMNKYSEKILGFMEHSDPPRRRKNRSKLGDDD